MMANFVDQAGHATSEKAGNHAGDTESIPVHEPRWFYAGYAIIGLSAIVGWAALAAPLGAFSNTPTPRAVLVGALLLLAFSVAAATAIRLVPRRGTIRLSTEGLEVVFGHRSQRSILNRMSWSRDPRVFRNWQELRYKGGVLTLGFRGTVGPVWVSLDPIQRERIDSWVSLRSMTQSTRE
jgi:hypothetical protein